MDASHPSTEPIKSYKYYDLIMAAFVTVLLCSGVIGVQKVSLLAGIPFGTAILFFPLSYLFGDVLTDVYGFARSRRVIWAGFGGLLFAAGMSWAVVLPARMSRWSRAPWLTSTIQSMSCCAA